MNSPIHMYTKIESGFEYVELTKYFSEIEIEKYSHKMRNLYIKEAKKWNDIIYTQWVLRTYLSVKMILACRVMLSSLEFAIEKNLRIVEPYLIYYSLLNINRALIYTLPNINWNTGNAMILSHEKIIKISSDAILQMNMGVGNKINETLNKAKVYRELFSYKFPTAGIRSDIAVDLEEAVITCALIHEIAQFNSEILEYTINRHVTKKGNLIDYILEKGFFYDLKQYSYIDHEDHYRINRLYGKGGGPFNLFLTTTEGLEEDFYGAWCPEDDDKDLFNPDSNIIRPII